MRDKQLRKLFTALLGCIIWLFCINKAVLAFDKKSSLSLAHYIVGAMYERLCELDEAIQEYKKALRADGKNAVIHLGLASVYLKKNDIPNAVKQLNLAKKADPQAVEPHAMLALLYFSQDKTHKAAQEYEKALEKITPLEPANRDIYKELGIVYLQQKNYLAAEKVFKSILNLSPDDAEAHYLLANIYDELKRREEAVEELKKALELDVDYHQALNYLGYLFVEEGSNLDEAETLIKKALEIEPDNGAYIDSLGWLYYKEGKFEKAIEELKRAIILLEDAVIYDHLGDAYFKIKDFKNAKLNWKKSLELDPKQSKVRKKLKEKDGL